MQNRASGFLRVLGFWWMQNRASGFFGVLGFRVGVIFGGWAL